MTFTPAEIEAVRAVMPHASDLTIRRHLQQRAALVRMGQERQREQAAEALRQFAEGRS